MRLFIIYRQDTAFGTENSFRTRMQQTRVLTVISLFRFVFAGFYGIHPFCCAVKILKHKAHKHRNGRQLYEIHIVCFGKEIAYLCSSIAADAECRRKAQKADTAEEQATGKCNTDHPFENGYYFLSSIIHFVALLTDLKSEASRAARQPRVCTVRQPTTNHS